MPNNTDPAREAAWKRDREQLFVLVHRGDFETRRQLRDAYELGYDAGAAREEWVAVSERNPPSGEYLVTVNGPFLMEAYFTDRWYSSEDDMEMTAARFNEVVAWMPMPKPYGGKDE